MCFAFLYDPALLLPNFPKLGRAAAGDLSLYLPIVRALLVPIEAEAWRWLTSSVHLRSRAPPATAYAFELRANLHPFLHHAPSMANSAWPNVA